MLTNIKTKKTIPTRTRKISLVNSAFRELVNEIGTAISALAQYRPDRHNPDYMRSAMLPVYKQLADLVPTLFNTDQVTQVVLSDLKIRLIEPIAGKVELTYYFHYEGKVVRHYLKFQHEYGPFDKTRPTQNWEIV